MVDTVLTNAVIASLGPRGITRGDVGVEDGRIAWVGQPPAASEPAKPAPVVDCGGRLVMPGNVCAHTHLYSALARGMPPPRRAPTNFLEILEFVWWRLDRALDEPSLRSSALVGALDAARSGTTTLVDHHASPNFIAGSLDALADALESVGLRSLLCYEVTDRGGSERREEGLRENERFARMNDRPLSRGMVGAHASFTLGDESLEAVAGLARDLGTGVHIHVAEDALDETDSLRRCGKRAAHRLSDHGLFDDVSIAAHGVHLDSGELETIHGHQTWLVHNCRSNLNNSVGRAPVAGFGLRSALGTDGIDGDMFAESRAAFFRAREDSLDAAAEDFTGMLARGGDLVSQHFGYPVGRLDEGAAADLMVLDYDPPTPLSDGNLPWHWMFAFTSQQVRDVMVQGRWVVREGEVCGVDEERIRAQAREEARRLWRRMEDL
jgi:putative selenium metabolism protein SsnA